MTCELVHASYSLPKWQAVKLTFLAPQCILSFLHHFISSISNNQLYLAGGSTEGLNFPPPIPCILGFSASSLPCRSSFTDITKNKMVNCTSYIVKLHIGHKATVDVISNKASSQPIHEEKLLELALKLQVFKIPQQFRETLDF